MTTTRRNHLSTTHDRSPFIAERRRKLFPIDDQDVDSELGHISPLCSDSTSDSDNEGITSITDYDIIGTVEKKKVLGNETPMSNKTYSDTMSPLRLSPYTSRVIKETPTKFSPSHNLKTPHDTSTKPTLQKEQKILLEESKSLKRKNSPDSSPGQNKSMKIDYKSSKVRTALFPPESEVYASLPTKSFYSKNQENILEKITMNKDKYIPKQIKFSTVKHSYRQRNKFGQINNGVRHKIRKPKLKKISQAAITKATKKLLQTGSVLNDYIQDLAELKNKQNTENKLIVNPATAKHGVATLTSAEDPTLNGYLNDVRQLETAKKLILTPVKQIKTITEENKENIQIESHPRSVSPLSLSSSEDLKSRKFFKSSRTKIVNKNVKINDGNKDLINKVKDTKSDSKKFTLPIDESQIATNKVQLTSSNDFEDEYMEPETNIDNILLVLSNESPQKHGISHNGPVSTVGLIENDCQFATGSNSNIFNPLNPNVISQNKQDSAEFPVCNSENAESNSRIFITTSDQTIDNGSYLQTNSNTGLMSTNLENAYITESHKGSVIPTDGQSTFIGTGFEVNLPTVENILGPSIVTSQVVFDNILLEDEIQTNQNEPLLNNMNFLETKGVPNNSNKITLEAHNSVLASENSIQLHQSNVANMILSPISQMCDVTSGLALNSPKKGRNLSSLLNNMSRASKILSFTSSNSVDMEQQQKLFPVFYPGAKGAPERGEKRERGEIKRNVKKFKALHEDQMLLDAGQKKFGYTICNECNTVYHMGDPGDEMAHMNYHNASHILRFSGWKNEHLVADFQKDGRIIRVLPSDSKIWLKKVKELMEFVKRDLGCYEMEYDISGSQVYLYIKNRTIAGCAVATVPKEGGHRMLSSLNSVAMCSEESYPIKCGISHIWVGVNFRKQGIATALMNAVKNNFIYGYILTNNDIALTSPTEAGSAFAEKYFKTPNYLVYYT